jgi:hypothetical protein
MNDDLITIDRQWDNLTTDLRTLKGRQWNVAYYVIAALFAVGSLWNALKPAAFAVGVALSVVTIVIAFSGTCLLIQFQCSLRRYRNDLERIEACYASPRMRDYRKKTESQRKCIDCFWKDADVMVAILTAQFIGSLLVLWFIWQSCDWLSLVGFSAPCLIATHGMVTAGYVWDWCPPRI